MKNIIMMMVSGILILALLFAGCVEQQTDNQQQDDIDVSVGEGTLLLKITDKPGDLEIIHANVTISMVQVHKSNETYEEEGDTESEEEIENIDDFGDSFIADGDGPYYAEIGEDIDFNGSAIGGIEPYNYSWNFGDGNSSYGRNVTHNYTINGTYTVNLTVKDNDTISKVDWYLTIANIGDVDEEDDTPTADWYTIKEGPQEFDLIALQDVTDVLGQDILPVGMYTQIRLTVEQANITIINETGQPEVYAMVIPSNNVKLIKPFWINKDETTELTLDFDVNESVHQTGNNKFMMKPTIKVIEG